MMVIKTAFYLSTIVYIWIIESTNRLQNVSALNFLQVDMKPLFQCCLFYPEDKFNDKNKNIYLDPTFTKWIKDTEPPRCHKQGTD